VAQLRTYEFTRWSGEKTVIAATQIKFTSGGGVVFLEGSELRLAVNRHDWNNIHELDDKTAEN